MVVYFIGRILGNRAYAARFRERLGFLPRSFNRTAPGSIWLHAVSAGEIVTAVPLLQQLHQQESRIPIFVSTSTLAGRAAAVKNLEGIAAGIFFCPLDFVSCLRRVLRTIKPALVIIMETEIWPNLYAEIKRTNASLGVVNARISDKTWPHYQATKWFFSPILKLVDSFFPQSATDRDRYFRLGVPMSRIHLEGNLKYDSAPAPSSTNLPTFGASPIWIAGSTVAPGESRRYKHAVDEDDVVLDAFEQLRKQFPKLLLILAPRQPARFNVVAEKLKTRQIPFLRRTQNLNGAAGALTLPGVLLLDTIGELAGAFPLADVVFIGGSVAPRGGHNILEPARCGAAIVTGCHMENFQAIATDFIEAGALRQVQNAAELAPVLGELLSNRETALHLGYRAQLLVEQKRGTASQIAQQLWPLYWSATPREPRTLLTKLILTPLSKCWDWGARLKRTGDEAKKQTLPVPVVSIGNITLGGTGKTPFTNYLATELQNLGYKPAILTRGYRRRTPARNLLLPVGAEVPPALTGDEAQIFLRAAVCPVGIGADRAETGRLLLQNFDVNLILLDDGFQHRKLHRNVDLVLIDGLTPFGQEAAFPLGRLREPLSCLKRADALVVTRADNDLRFESLTRQLRRYNPHAPIYRVFTRPKHWRMCQQKMTVGNLPSRRIAAFCGLGNPQGFWNTLAQMEFEVVYRWTFPDHHVYRPAELKHLALQAQSVGADLLVTTEKDRINFPPDFALNVAPLEVAWLEIENRLDGEQAFFTWLQEKLSAVTA